MVPKVVRNRRWNHLIGHDFDGRQQALREVVLSSRKVAEAAELFMTRCRGRGVASMFDFQWTRRKYPNDFPYRQVAPGFPPDFLERIADPDSIGLVVAAHTPDREEPPPRLVFLAEMDGKNMYLSCRFIRDVKRPWLDDTQTLELSSVSDSFGTASSGGSFPQQDARASPESK